VTAIHSDLVQTDDDRRAKLYFVRASDFAPMPGRIVDMFNDGTEDRGDLLYVENVAARGAVDPGPADPAVRR
jgi:hypothetical protein